MLLILDVVVYRLWQGRKDADEEEEHGKDENEKKRKPCTIPL